MELSSVVDTAGDVEEPSAVVDAAGDVDVVEHSSVVDAAGDVEEHSSVVDAVGDGDVVERSSDLVPQPCAARLVSTCQELQKFDHGGSEVTLPITRVALPPMVDG